MLSTTLPPVATVAEITIDDDTRAVYADLTDADLRAEFEHYSTVASDAAEHEVARWHAANDAALVAALLADRTAGA